MLAGWLSATLAPALLKTISSPKLSRSVEDALVMRTKRTPAADGEPVRQVWCQAPSQARSAVTGADKRRTRLLPWSATAMLPLAATAMPVGWLKLAAAPAPSADPALPLPASVVTTPEGVTSLTRLLKVSATKITPVCGSRATPQGLLKLAAAPAPSAKAALPLPASVVV